MSTSEYRIVSAPDGLWTGNVRAYRQGDLVHPDAVKENGWEDGTVGQATKTAQRAAADAGTQAPRTPRRTSTKTAKTAGTQTPTGAEQAAVKTTGGP